ncbi:uncharacterized protein METZ01_LOCUS345218, partial [marine metagenome]
QMRGLLVAEGKRRLTWRTAHSSGSNHSPRRSLCLNASERLTITTVFPA